MSKRGNLKPAGQMMFDAMPNEMVEIGENVTVKPFACLGFLGFSFEKTKKGKLKKPYRRVSHPYKLILEKNVEIGAGCCIDRGSWRESIIGEGTKIDNLCHTGHNTQIGKHCILACGVILGGSTTIGDECQLGMACRTNPHITITHHVTIGTGAVVTKDITEPYTTWAGIPARKVKDEQVSL